ncbi:MAG: DMT family transporter [Algibacter sp.]
MIFLLLSIIASTLIFIIFKSFTKHNVNTLQAIIVNYFIACSTGIFNSDVPVSIPAILNEEWFFGALFLGFLFISIFNVMALTAQRNGLSVASVASKMSVIIPVIFGLYVYNESAGWLKIIGIILALVAVYLTSVKGKSSHFTLKGLWLPIVLFFGSGILDTTLKFLETSYVSKNGIPIFSATIFFIAGSIGVLTICIKAIKTGFHFSYKSVIGGIILGIVNYYSIYLLLKALQFEGFESSTIFTINNVAVVMLTTLLGLSIFKEKLHTKNWIGIAIAIVSIILVSLS